MFKYYYHLAYSVDMDSKMHTRCFHIVRSDYTTSTSRH